MHRLKLLAAALAAAASCAAAAEAAGVSVLWLESANRTASNRTLASVDRVVVHVTEGSFWGSVRWLRNRRSHGSSHYVVSRRGEIVQLVSSSHVAWHAGNRNVNRRSIGIEHEGWTARGGFTEAQYRASAQLTAWLGRRAEMPLDRRHVIGHDEVPSPNGRGRGGINHHSDPGRRWSWQRYMRLVRHFAKHPVQPRYVKTLPTLPAAPPLPPAPSAARAAPRRSVVVPGATLKGTALWWSGIDAAKRWRRGIHRVDFFVDGRLLWTDRVWPFAFRGGAGWNTRTVADGRHLLTLRLHGRRGYRARRTIAVRVDNPPLELAISGLADHGAARGAVTLTVRPSEPVERIALYVDGRAVSRDARPPYRLRWDSETVDEGPRELLVYARARSGRRVARPLRVVVANAEGLPPSLDLALGGAPVAPPGP
ncbi:MAG: N-acetylmuramoyl-L-alanine amidase [Gaiellaceae bacterium]|nr:N-acetylmuramoyl-L-alanine amidase [Gaiellaceae bacterium]